MNSPNLTLKKTVKLFLTLLKHNILSQVNLINILPAQITQDIFRMSVLGPFFQIQVLKSLLT